MPADKKEFSRRDLFRAASLATVSLGMGSAAADQDKRKTEDRNKNTALPRRRLGRTNLMVTTIGAGGAGISAPEILERAIDHGVNYVDTAPVYSGSEAVFGEVMSRRRKDVFLATKWYVSTDWTVDRCLTALDRSLKRLQTDHVDLLQLHSVDDVHNPDSTLDGLHRIDNPNLHKAMETARRDGKVRFFGVSSHNFNRKALLMHAIDTGLFDTILVAFNYTNYESSGMPELLAYAKKHDIGVIGMKAGSGNVRVPNVDPLSAQLAWVLSKDIHTVINSRVVESEEGQDACLAAAKVKIAQSERDTLERYAAAVANEYCRGCAHICESACPADVRIADILRFDMYHRHYGGEHQEFARQSYAELAANERVQSFCATCRKCEEACPYDLPILDKLHYAERVLT